MKQILLSFAIVSALAIDTSADEGIKKLPVPAFDPIVEMGHPEKIVVAGGCFWGVQFVFQHVKGVKSADLTT
jgi:peptide-methionine (S)-S-oxide reductase